MSSITQSRDALPISDPQMKVNPWIKELRGPNLRSASFSWSYSRQGAGNPLKPGNRMETTSIPGCKRAVSREKFLLVQPIPVRQIPERPVQLQIWINWNNAGKVPKVTGGHPNPQGAGFGQSGDGWMKGKSNFCLQIPTRDSWRRRRQRRRPG